MHPSYPKDIARPASGGNISFPTPEEIKANLEKANREAASALAAMVADGTYSASEASQIAREQRFEIVQDGAEGAPASCRAAAAQPLGKNTKLVDASEYLTAIETVEKSEEKTHQARRRNWLIHDAAAKLLQGTKQDRVCYCKRSIAYGASGVAVVVTKEERASWGNLTLCGNVWTCPNCSPIISAERAKEANQALEWSRKRVAYQQADGKLLDRIQATPMMLTLTARHGREDDLADLSSKILAAKQEMFQSRLWKKLRVELVWQPVFLKQIGTKRVPEADPETGACVWKEVPVYNETLEDTGMPCLVERTRKTIEEPISDPITGRPVLKKDGTQKTRRKTVEPYKVKVQKKRCTGWKHGSGVVIGILVAYEITHTPGGGWHPHFHLIILVDTTTEKQAKRHLTPLRKAWLLALKNNGLHAKAEVGFRLDGGAQAGNYVSKFGAGTGIEFSDERKCLADAKARQDWGMVEELTAARAKKARKPGAGVTPWELLEHYAFPEEQVIEDRNDLSPKKAGFLFAEFAQAFHGKQQLQWSPGLKDLVGVRERTDEEIMEEIEGEEEEERRIPAMVAPEDWKHLCTFTTRADRNSFLRFMHLRTPEEFWAEFETFLGRKPIRSVDEARKMGEEMSSGDKQSRAIARRLSGD